jgi:hypothetical protein
MSLCGVLLEKRDNLTAQIKDVDLEVEQANGTAARLHSLVFGSEESSECSGGCPK